MNIIFSLWHNHRTCNAQKCYMVWKRMISSRRRITFHFVTLWLWGSPLLHPIFRNILLFLTISLLKKHEIFVMTTIYQPRHSKRFTLDPTDPGNSCFSLTTNKPCETTIAVCACNDKQRTWAAATICLMLHTKIKCTTPSRQAAQRHPASSKPTQGMHPPCVRALPARGFPLWVL